MPRPRKQIMSPEKGIDERSPLKLVLRLPVPKETDVSLSCDGADLNEIDENLQNDAIDDEGGESEDSNAAMEILQSYIREGQGSSASKSVDSLRLTLSGRKKRGKKKKFKLTMPSNRVPRPKNAKNADGTETKDVKKVKKIGIDSLEIEMETEESSAHEGSPSPVVPVEQPKPELTSMQKLLDNLLKTFERKDPDSFFKLPVTDEIAPNYSTVISTPMDFSTMRQKLERNLYGSLPEFKKDIEQIAHNAVTYNEPNSVYHLAAKKLMNIADYLFSKEKLLFLRKTCSFMTSLTEADLGVDLRKPLVHKEPKPSLANYACIVDDMNAEEVLTQVSVASSAAAARLAARKPNIRAAYMSGCGENGEITLKMLTPEKISEGRSMTAGATDDRTFSLSDIVPKLKEGNPGMPRWEEHPANLVVPYNSLDYGPYSSFAPVYDSTWATMSKDESDLLLSAYGGDETCVSYVESIKNYVNDSTSDLIKMVDGLLDALTDGEHSKHSKKTKKNRQIVVDKVADIVADVAEGGVFSDRGDVEVAKSVQEHVANGVDDKLAETCFLLSDLQAAQYQRLSQPPPFVLTEALGPSTDETNIAEQLLTNLTALTSQTNPGHLVTSETVRSLMMTGQPENADSNGSDEYDMDVFREFFQVDSST